MRRQTTGQKVLFLGHNPDVDPDLTAKQEIRTGIVLSVGIVTKPHGAVKQIMTMNGLKDSAYTEYVNVWSMLVRDIGNGLVHEVDPKTVRFIEDDLPPKQKKK